MLAAGRVMAMSLAALGATPALAFDMPAGADPVYAELVGTCLGALGLETSFDPEGWVGHDTGDADAVAWINSTRSFMTKDFPGVGSGNLSTTLETYPGYALGVCEADIAQPSRSIAVGDLSQSGIVGSIEGEGSNLSGSWRNADATLFIRATMSDNTGDFRLSVTSITKED